MTHSGPAGSPESDGVLPTRREARALREAAEAAALAATADIAVSALSAAAPLSEPAVPVPAVPVVSVSPDLAAVVESATTSSISVVASAPLSRPETAPPGSTVPGLSVPESVVSAPAGDEFPPSRRESRQRAAVGPTRVVRAPSAPAKPAAGSAKPAGSTPVRRPKRNKPLAKLVTLMAIPAVFLTAALPAYAFSPQGSAGFSAQSSVDTQAVTVAAAAAAVTISADGFSATSQAELDDIEAGLQASQSEQRAAEQARASAAEYAVYGIRSERDDYPWPTSATDAQGGGLSPLGYYYRECVDFVAWRLNRDAGSTGSPWKWTWHSMTPGGGDASSWANAWSAKGWPTSKTPIVGAVAWFTYNHVAYVQSVPGDGTVVLEEYNWMGSHAYHTRTVPISEVPMYLYPPS
ncbi:CHAP domain-containing protein [Cryobacterium soli]|uniref:CHAP domain-containing protein n=1 Tax=Cryobacterium soli TaxID=2220095 RepID=UPI0013C44A96|nr:CHAP domain-containing protein [Cryobacterium soli]